MSPALLEVVTNQLIGAVIGLAVSFIISWYFYKKADIPTRTIRQMVEQLSLSIMQEKLGVDLVPEVTPEAERPKDLDVPHIMRFWRSCKNTKPGEFVVILFRVRDEGLNFAGDIKISDKKTGLSFEALNRIYGYWSTEITIPDNVEPGHHQVTFQLTDRHGKTHSHLVDIEVT